MEREAKVVHAMALDDDQIRALDRPTAWAYICALEGLAGNTDTDPRWQRASEIREIIAKRFEQSAPAQQTARPCC